MKPATHLGGDWKPDANGYPRRAAARVVVIDEGGNALLVHGHDLGDPSHAFWFAVGGGIGEKENAREAAARELTEETGLQIPPGHLEGPVATRTGRFHFAAGTAIQDETFFITRIAGRRPRVRPAKLSETEQQALDELRWFSTADLEEPDPGQVFYPRELPELIAAWARGWDGSVPHISA